MHEELVFGFLDQLRPLQHDAGLCQEEADHEQRVAPELLVMLVPHGAVLKAAVLRAGHFLQHPGEPALDDGEVFFVLRFTVEAGQRQYRRHGVHIPVRLIGTGKHIVVPPRQVCQDGRITALLPGFVNPVERHAGGPLPVVHGQMTPGGIVPVRALEHRQNPVRCLPVGFTHQTHLPVTFCRL